MKPFHSMRNTKQNGLLLVIVSGIVYGLQPIMVSFGYTHGANAALVVVARYGAVALMLLPFVLRRKNNREVLARHWKGMAGLCFTSAATPILLYNSYAYISTGISTSLHFVYPVFVVLLSAVFFHDRPSKRKLLCTLLCFAGMLLIIDTSFGAASVAGVLLALCSGLTWALYIVWLAKLDLKDVSSEQLLCFVEGGAALLIAVVFAPLLGRSIGAVSAVGWAYVVFISVVIGLFGTIFFSLGVRWTDAQTSAIASTLEPIVGVMIGIVFLREPFSLRTLLGSILIVGAVILLTIHPENQK